MICERIRELREIAGYSQADLARKLDVTRSSVNAWEMGLSMPTTYYVVAMARLFHVSTDYLLGIDTNLVFSVDGYSTEEVALIHNLIKYIDQHKTT